jgi:predicted TIM-barrel fold metal-dependent hydrolase
MPTQVITLEEHLVTEEVLREWPEADRRDLAMTDAAGRTAGERLLETGAVRQQFMDDMGVDVQVLSLSTPGVNNVEGQRARDLQQRTNDHIAELVAGSNGRYQGFATLATGDPEAAAKELDRAVTTLGLDGAMVFPRAGGRTLDDPALLPLFEVAAARKAPLYIHPQVPPQPVLDASYGGLGELGDALGTFGMGWHYDAGLQLIRLIAAGVLERFPDVRIILGHWGEMALFYLDRIDNLQHMAKLPLKPSEYVRRQVWVTPGGILSPRYLRWTREVLGPDHTMLALDYPFPRNEPQAFQDFLAEIPADERDAVSGGTWLGLRDGIRR